jgi:hypothetical protein
MGKGFGAQHRWMAASLVKGFSLGKSKDPGPSFNPPFRKQGVFMTKKYISLLANLLTLAGLLFGMTLAVQAAPLPNKLAGKTYYVSTTGKDSNAGTIAAPWRTIMKAAGKVAAGDTVYIRGGIYQEAVTLYTSGTAALPIKFLAYPGEAPVIDGNNYALPSYWGTMLRISGNYIEVSGLEVRYSNWMGVTLVGQHLTARNLNVHHIRETGLLVSGDYGLVEDCRVWQNANRNEKDSPYTGGGWATGLSAARSPNFVTLRRNVVYNNWGEGLSTFEANQITMEDNIVYDNWSANVYISDATNVLFQRNLVYRSPNSVIQAGSRIGILMGDEVYDPASSDITIINNLVYGANRNLWWWQGPQGGGMKNVLVANNTFVNSVSGSGIQIDDGSHQNTRFISNIVQQDGALPVTNVETTTGLTFAYNLWSKTPPANVSESTDVVGNPQLAQIGSANAGQLTGDWFLLLNTSPARDQAQHLDAVILDYFSNARDASPDIGAVEYGAVAPQTATFYSAGAYDGWVLEKAETSGQGGAFSAKAATLQVGDDKLNRQYRSILSFNTATLPANAVILSAVLLVKQSGTMVGKPFSTLGSLRADVRKGVFGATTLAAADFQTPATVANAGIFGSKASAGWYKATINAAGRKNINPGGLTQIRLRFNLDDDNDHTADYLKLVSGNAATGQPTLVIIYTVP